VGGALPRAGWQAAGAGAGRTRRHSKTAPTFSAGDRRALRRRQPARAANTPGIRHIAFAVEDIAAVVAGLRARGAELVGELERYEDSYRLCYVRGPDNYRIELIERR
jgi:catechol 2,3-dioxygenase-like lactoylglutathione lyase family enzyme